ncbi:MAG: hypothetical protein CMJ64_29145 [Planctomycetaceae bacterium]|nr:hypothetical protein [Planctomycetaceae bacterium]
MRCLLIGLAITASWLGLAIAKDEAAAKENRWEKTIQGFEELDRKAMPPKGGVLFVGSSSIRMWDLNKWLPKLETLNRGFGGSEVSDAVQFADRIILKHEPRAVAVYAGDNDLSRGKSPEQVRDDFKELVSLIHGKLPKTKIVYIAIKPSIKRWKLIDKVREANQMIVDIAKKNEQIVFIDIDKPMIGEDGLPRKELFIPDRLHLSDEGYELWSTLVRPHIVGNSN